MDWLPDWTEVITRFDAGVEAAMVWTGQAGAGFFSLIRAGLEGGYDTVLWLLTLPPWWGLALAFALIGWRCVGLVFGLLAGIGIAFCYALGLWEETVQTMGLVLSATTMAVIIGALIGIAAGYSTRFGNLLEPVLDLVQTLPPYIYLLPSIAFLGYGPATAILATFIVAVPPTIRLTALGIRRTPVQFLELGQATGATGWQIFTRIRQPFALRSLMTGVNQSLMMAFGMVVIAGIVGSGGLGQTIYDAVRKLDIARSFDAAIAIVILTIVLDRISQSAAGKEEKV